MLRRRPSARYVRQGRTHTASRLRQLVDIRLNLFLKKRLVVLLLNHIVLDGMSLNFIFKRLNRYLILLKNVEDYKKKIYSFNYDRQ